MKRKQSVNFINPVLKTCQGVQGPVCGSLMKGTKGRGTTLRRVMTLSHQREEKHSAQSYRSHTQGDTRLYTREAYLHIHPGRHTCIYTREAITIWTPGRIPYGYQEGYPMDTRRDTLLYPPWVHQWYLLARYSRVSGTEVY